MAALKVWVQAARLRTLPLALSAIGLGGFLAAFFGAFDPLIFFLCLLTTLFLQILSNFANDYGDTVHGADSVERKGPLRAVQQGAISSTAMKNAIVIVGGLSLLSGLLLLYFAFQSISLIFLFFLVLGIASIAAAIKYTAGKNPYGYSGFGDLFVFLFFGLTGVLGTYYLQATSFSIYLLLPASSAGFFSVAVLNINNIRDIQSDQKAGKYSIPVRIGEKAAKVYHTFLLITGFAAAVVFTFIYYRNPFQFLFLITLPLFVFNGVQVWKRSGKDLDPLLKQMAISTLLFVVLFGTGFLLSLK